MTPAARLALAVLLISVADSAPHAQVVFRSRADLVMVPVWVTDDSRAVSGLAASAFRLTDNGTAQEISLEAVEAVPLDVTLVLDASGSVDGPALDRFKDDIQQVSPLLRPIDRVRLITFASAAADVFSFQPGGSRLPLNEIQAGGLTAFYNALIAAMIATGPADRAQLVFALSDGVDTMSFLDADDVVSLASRSSATLYVALRQVTSTGARLSPYDGGPNVNRLRTAAERSGGELYRLSARTSLPAVFQRVLEDFRGGYLLTYVPRGVVSGGWHEIVVSTTNKRHSVRARKGYEGR